MDCGLFKARAEFFDLFFGKRIVHKKSNAGFGARKVLEPIAAAMKGSDLNVPVVAAVVFGMTRALVVLHNIR